MNRVRPSFFSDPRLQLLLFGGKGGVGKTSCASASAWILAESYREAQFLLVSTDPAHSLADSFARSPPPPNLRIVELDAQSCLEEFRRKHRQKLREITARGTFLDEDDVGQLLHLSLPGLDELMAFLEIAKWVETGAYQCVVVDTAPTGHTLRLLAMPALIRQWLAALNALLAKHRYLKQLYRGSYQRDEIDFFLEYLAAAVTQMETLLRDPIRCRFVPVMLAEPMSLSETAALLRTLKRVPVPVTDIVVNGLLLDRPCAVCQEGRSRQLRVLNKLEALRDFSGCALWGVPLYSWEVCGSESLTLFWAGGTELARALPPGATPNVLFAPRVEAASEVPLSEKTLLLFAGKGGVGKTTLACATAWQLAEDFPGKEVLLFSTDPAHSLAYCLEQPVGPAPQRLGPGLTALELDAPAEFAALKQMYSRELAAFLKSVSSQADIAYDGDAMEKLLDLSPPGLDEVMALTRVMGLLRQGHYHTVVLDSAPTGHLIRLLEMPELIDQWLKFFFGLFLKYKRIFHLPQVTQRLIEMSHNLKHLRALLSDPTQCALCGVSILTEMAFQETQDLLAACARLRVSMPVLFLNLATPPSDCSLCAALQRRESVIRTRYKATFPGMPQVLVYRQGEPRGQPRLTELGHALHRTPVLT